MPWYVAPAPVWDDPSPIREELFSVGRLKQHGASLASAQVITDTPVSVGSLHLRLRHNAKELLLAYRAGTAEVARGGVVVPAAEWLLDNFHLVDEHIREIWRDLPAGYYRQLPKLANGPFAGYPRVFGIAWAYVAHTDSHFDPETFFRFIKAYQRVQPLSIGELWAAAITLRIVLIENLRRLADQMTAGRIARAEANALADRFLTPGQSWSALQAYIDKGEAWAPSEVFAAQLAKRLRDQDPTKIPAFEWLDSRLKSRGTSIDDVVAVEQNRLGASNVSVRNIITSLRTMSEMDWADLVEDASLVDEKLCAASTFADMDFATRNLYRNAIERLARGSSLSEIEIVETALDAARTASQEESDAIEAARIGDPGYHLIGKGTVSFEAAIGYRPTLRLRVRRRLTALGIGGYVSEILLVTAVILGLGLWILSAFGLSVTSLVLAGMIGFIPTTDVATAVVNRAIIRIFGAKRLPGLELKEGVPEALRTLVVVPSMLTDEADVLEQVERLEVHHLSGRGGDLTFALLLDGLDADEELVDRDAPLLAKAVEAVNRLNQRHGEGPAGKRFLLLHRRRLFNPSEGKWMGWERKRGKLHELNRLLRGATDTTFIPPIGAREPHVPANVRYVITLDADTKLPREAVVRLVGKMAHPLNRPKFSSEEQRVVAGYAILQPRITPSLPMGRDGSFFQRATTGPGGMDPYAAAVSDVYQDLFNEGSYTGKGIYDVDAFEAALAGRVPENTLLSHDLFEGVFARAGLASDVEVVEEFPARYDVMVKRQHRWTRGDWQLLPWLFRYGKVGKSHLPPIGAGKILDNLRRSTVTPFLFAGFCLSWLIPPPGNLVANLIVLALIAIPPFFPVLFSLLPRPAGIRLRLHFSLLASEVRLASIQTALSVIALADQSWRMGDAIIRSLIRLFVTRRHLLEWTTSAHVVASQRLSHGGFYRDMAGGILLAVAVSAGVWAVAPASWPLILAFALLWLAAPALAHWASRLSHAVQRPAVSGTEARSLRRTARRSWHYFEMFVTPDDNMLPPDNLQEDPQVVIARRTSPTNIGLYLLATIAARDFGWAGTTQTIDRLEATFATLEKLNRFKGHFFNWYGTQDMKALDPAYISSVDSGNLAGHLIVMANACDEWRNGTLSEHALAGIVDTLDQAHAALDTTADEQTSKRLSTLLHEIEVRLQDPQLQGPQLQGPQLQDQSVMQVALVDVTPLAQEAVRISAEMSGDYATLSGEVTSWIAALNKVITAHGHDQRLTRSEKRRSSDRLQRLAEMAREMAMAMDFEFLLNADGRLLSIGYSMADWSLDESSYDLLASEARLASLFAIAKGDVETKHWFRLGRATTPVGGQTALVSWSGSMFEYLMPSLVMRAPVGSVLEQTNRTIVACQQQYGRLLGIPWGISESAFNARDLEFTYQYSSFGVPELGLKRGLAADRVIAPYATGLAAMVEPQAAVRNFRHLEELGAMGRYGFYEALDFTRARVPDNQTVAIVRSFMAHHQGMTIVAIANVLQRGRMRDRFHREPMIKASELLLQERLTRRIAIARPPADEIKITALGPTVDTSESRRIIPRNDVAPVTHLLSNGRYTVMLTSMGGGFSHWGDTAITRWREDVTQDNWGSHIFLRDVNNGTLWEACALPVGAEADHQTVIFSEDHAEFKRRDGALSTIMEVVVSGEDDGEVRRVSLINSGWKHREIDLTSYAELVLTTPATDAAHPAFAKMFVETEYCAEFGALIARRRPRTPGEAQVWAAQFAIIEGEQGADPQYETDRARFLDRNRPVGVSAGLAQGHPLSNTVGIVLDPIFSLRYRVKVPAGKTVRVAFWTVVASSRAELLDLIDKHHDRSAFERAKTLAWTQAQVQLRHLAVEPGQAADFQSLAAPLLYADPRFRASSACIIRGAKSQSALWPLAISGDLPLILLRIDDIRHVGVVRTLLQAHEYWRMKRLASDLVIINEGASSYKQDLQGVIDTDVRSHQSRPGPDKHSGQGSVYALRADLMSAEARGTLESAARIVLLARHGAIDEQLRRIDQEEVPLSVGLRSKRQAILPPDPEAMPTLEFFNGLGGFDKNGREYVIILDADHETPAPWINVVANPGFGFQAAAEGNGYIWSENSRNNQLTPWSNDPIENSVGDAIYVKDLDSGELWCPTALPINDGGRYIARHGFGYSRFEHKAHGIGLELLQYVPLVDPVKLSRLTVRNISERTRRLSVTGYVAWVLGAARGASAPFIITETDKVTGAILARNPWSLAFADRIAFADLGGQQKSWTADRTEFIGRSGELGAPAALSGNAPLSGAAGGGLDPCAALQDVLELAPGAEVEVVFLVGQGASADQARALIKQYRAADLDAVLQAVETHWQTALGAVQVKTPDRAMDIMMNGWLHYQTLACRILARSAFYQSSGAYGFRDQLQDGMALTLSQPEETRQHILRAAARQFVEGDVQHWWLPESGQGVRTRISDDRVWLAFATATYIHVSGDSGILDEMIPFLTGPDLAADEQDAFFLPGTTDESASLFEHCARALDQSLDLIGEHGLPLMGAGDWNDGMNLVGHEGKGESVWLGWLMACTIDLFAPYAQVRAPDRTHRWQSLATSMKQALEREAWDGEWYRRATFDDGTWLGSKDSDECCIDSIAQSWAVLSGVADPARATQAMESLERHLINKEDGLALLFTPAFDTTPLEPGYIKGYPPGLRENGGQYSHAAMWSILAFIRLGNGNKAWDLFAMVNPINHALTKEAVARYKVEPYVVAADIYAADGHVGMGGWTWYTGSAGWMYQAGLDGILGIRREGEMLIIDPCIPSAWPGFEVSVTIGSSQYKIGVDNPARRCGGITTATLDGVAIHPVDGNFRVPLDGRAHEVLASI